MNKKERKEIAQNHNYQMILEHQSEINYSINNSVLFTQRLCLYESMFKTTPTIVVKDMTTQEAIFDDSDMSETVVLNFASNTRAGGGFINGAIAQEESLCHSSYLFNVLSAFNDHYNNNFETKKGGHLYYNWAIYTPSIMFENGRNGYIVNVITCPAPNYDRYYHYNVNQPHWHEDYIKALNSRIEYILDIAQIKGQTNLILGAFGCGVFGNDPSVVATAFKELLSLPKYTFKKVTFAIPKGTNYDKFKEVFG